MMNSSHAVWLKNIAPSRCEPRQTTRSALPPAAAEVASPDLTSARVASLRSAVKRSDKGLTPESA